MSAKDRNLRSNSVMNSSVTDRTELTSIIREVIREEIVMAFDLKLQPLKDSIDTLQETMKDTSLKLQEVEKAVTDNDRRLSDVEDKCVNLLSENIKLREKIQQIEDHSRKFNIRIIGIPNGAEGGSPTLFVNNFLKEMFGADKIGQQPCVNFAHRTGPQSTGSRCMIARLFSLEMKRTIIRLAGEAAGNLKFQGKKIHIFSDFSADLLKRRAAFKEVKNLLRAAGVKHGILHPCKLIITHQNSTMTFVDTKEAMTYFEQVIKPSLRDL